MKCIESRSCNKNISYNANCKLYRKWSCLKPVTHTCKSIQLIKHSIFIHDLTTTIKLVAKSHVYYIFSISFHEIYFHQRKEFSDNLFKYEKSPKSSVEMFQDTKRVFTDLASMLILNNHGKLQEGIMDKYPEMLSSPQKII